MKHIFFSVCVLSLSTATAEADLRYTTRLEVRMPAEFKLATPPIETLMLVKDGTIRIEHTQGTARSVLLIRPDGQFVLNLDQGTYRRIPDVQAVLSPRAAVASPAFRSTGEFTTILGLRAQRVEVTMSVPLPMTPPPGVPTVLPVTGDLWVADAYRTYTRSISDALGLSIAPTPPLDGIVLRQVVRNAQFRIEIEQVVTELTEGPLLAEMFELPQGFRLIGPAARP